MKFLFDFFPIALFFIVYKAQGIYLATGVAIFATLFQLIWVRYKTGAYSKSTLISFFSILVLGGTSILLRDEMFIKWKTTCVYWVLALVFLLSQVFRKRTIIEQIMQQSIILSPKTWQQLNVAWIVFFTLMGFINLFVVYNFDTNTWVNFKLFGTLGLTLLFIVGQGICIAKHIPKEDRSGNK